MAFYDSAFDPVEQVGDPALVLEISEGMSKTPIGTNWHNPLYNLAEATSVVCQYYPDEGTYDSYHLIARISFC